MKLLNLTRLDKITGILAKTEAGFVRPSNDPDWPMFSATPYRRGNTQWVKTLAEAVQIVQTFTESNKP